MELVTLSAGLLVPWLTGALWLSAVESRLGGVPQPNRLRQLGYGFFLGYAILVLAVRISDAWFGQVFWSGVMLAISLLAVCGGVASTLAHRNFGTTIAAPPRPQTSGSLLAAFFAAWAGLHFTLAAIEVVQQPLYPWDAWLAWVYRAKAWYLAGGMVDFVGPAEWVAASSARIYTIDAAAYPLLPSVVPYWAALSLGRWSETLINLPVLMAGAAIGLGLYGQCRESGMTRRFSVVAIFLFFSVPLIGTHIALAGYADIWMAGFAGLGFIALMRGAIAGQGFQTALGFLMIGLAMLTKNEGVVWFLAALLMQALITLPWRTSVLVGFAAVTVVWVAYMMGVTQVDIPLIGVLGVVDGRLQIPFIGQFVLEIHNVWQPYMDNFFAMGSWNLLWVLVGYALLVGLVGRQPGTGPTRRAATVFICTFLATQLFIFGLTDQGIWADTYTAINRLPLHFVPALIYAALVIFWSRTWQPKPRIAERTG